MAADLCMQTIGGHQFGGSHLVGRQSSRFIGADNITATCERTNMHDELPINGELTDVRMISGRQLMEHPNIAETPRTSAVLQLCWFEHLE